MRISYNWIKELVPDLEISPQELAQLLTLHSFETTVIGEYSVPAGITTVKITKIEKHPNADRLRLATVTDGNKEFTVICGAPNIEIGQVVPYSAPGAELKDEEGKSFKVKEAKIRGVASPGMLNSLRELGLHHDHGGIWVLDIEGVLKLGVELRELIPSDTILEADITPNRAHDCSSHIGVAREVAALLNLTVKEPAIPELPKPQAEVSSFTITLEDPRLSPRYLGAVIENLKIGPSPLWLQARLLAAGGKPINNLVDITNYTLYEYGNPTHLFDQAKLDPERSRRAKTTIGIRLAKQKEVLALLDDTEQTLTTDDLLITADGEPVALAGVMGGQASGIAETTTQGFLEVANFNAYSVQETSRRLGLRTESSTRFSKDLDPNLVTPAAARAVALLQEHAGGKLVGLLDAYPKPVHARTISFDPARVSRVAGTDVPVERSVDILKRLRFSVSFNPLISKERGDRERSRTVGEVKIPTDRRDIEGEHDLVEEVIRVIGLDKIQPKPLPALRITHRSLPPAIYWREIVRDTLVEFGLTETYNYSFEPAAYAELAGVAEKSHLTLANPTAPDLANLRVSLLPGLLANLDKNHAAFHREPQGLFEIGHVYSSTRAARSEQASRRTLSLSNGKPDERVPGVIEQTHLAAVIVGAVPTLDQIAAEIASALSLDELTFSNIITPAQTTALKYNLPVSGFEINLDELLARVEKDVPVARTLDEIKSQPITSTKYIPLPKYPSVFRDVSFLVDSNVSVEQAQDVIERAGGDLLVDSDLFDEFQAAGSDRKSLAFHLEYRAGNRTLTDADINPIHAKIIAALEAELSAEIR